MEYYLRSRFEKKLKKSVEDFLESISFDKRLAKCDIEGSIAHVKMLAKCKIINPKELQKIIGGLKEIAREIELGKFKFKKKYEDIHMNIEAALAKKIGEPAKKMHQGRSRNDQISLDMRMYTRDEIAEIILSLTNFMKRLFSMAKKYHDVIMPGYTHLQPSEPILFSWYLLAYYCMFKRDAERLYDVRKRVNIMPLGTGAIAGSYLPINREYVAKLLNFPKITANSIDTVSDRDFIIEFLGALSILMMHLSRLSEDLVLWSSPQYEFIEFDDSFCTGSSMMPQKKNPDVAEIIRAKTGRVYGDLVSLLTIMKGLPMAYNRDMQEDKEPLFDAIDTVKKCLAIYPDMLKSAKVYTKNMQKAVIDHFTWSAELASLVEKKGYAWRDAYEAVATFILTCVQKEISVSNYKSFKELKDKVLSSIPRTKIKRRNLREENE